LLPLRSPAGEEMKTRNGFVSNSSTSSFILGKNLPNAELIIDLLKKAGYEHEIGFIEDEEVEEYYAEYLKELGVTLDDVVIVNISYHSDLRALLQTISLQEVY
jgi:hypothetical protein